MLACEAEFRLELAAIEDEGLGDPALNRLVPKLSFGQAGQGALDERLGFPAYLHHRHSTTDRNKGSKDHLKGWESKTCSRVVSNCPLHGPGFEGENLARNPLHVSPSQRR